jgi:hypothetical protein
LKWNRIRIFCTEGNFLIPFGRHYNKVLCPRNSFKTWPRYCCCFYQVRYGILEIFISAPFRLWANLRIEIDFLDNSASGVGPNQQALCQKV